jgi:hypothetical protein
VLDYLVECIHQIWSTAFLQLDHYRVQTGCFVVFQVFYGFNNFVTAWQIDNNVVFEARGSYVARLPSFRLNVFQNTPSILTKLGLY